MKTWKYLAIFALLIAFMSSPVHAASQWELLNVDGDTDPSDLDDAVQQQNDALDRLARYHREGCMLLYSSASEMTIQGPCSAMICNSGGTDCEMRYSLADVTVSWADIDTGSESDATVTQYYVYLTADTDVAGFVEKISTSATAPSGATAYRQIGYFTNDASDDIVSVGNIAGGDVTNVLQATATDDLTTTSTSYTDMTDMAAYFVSSARPAMLCFEGGLGSTSNINIDIVIDVDGTDENKESWQFGVGNSVETSDTANFCRLKTDLTAGAHTIKAQWKAGSAGTANMYGSAGSGTGNVGDRKLTITEL